jgi:LacI family transcriptional regulator
MRPRLQRLSLVDQLDVALREGLARGDWPDWLPSERQLCADLQVGRNSLRAALQRLADEGMVEIVPGQGTRNSGRISDPPTPEPNVFGLLSPISLEQLRPRQALWIDELRRVLSEAGGGLRFVHGPQFFRTNPAPALQRLVSHERCGGWILVRSTKVIQLWFARHGVPCVIAGSCHQGVDLPFVDLDYQAMCRHAATTLLQLGHRRIAFLTQVADAAGDLRSELGFVEGVEKFPAVGIEGKVVHHDSETRSVAQCVRRLMQGPRAPTALVVNQSYHYLTVFSVLVQLGRRIPQDVSLICRDDDRFLAFLEPEPARYVENPHLFARKLARIAMATFRERPAQPMRLQIMPRLMRGASISRCAAPEGNEAKA